MQDHPTDLSDEPAQASVAVYARNGHVVIHYGRPVTWMSLDVEAAEGLRAVLDAKIETARKQRTLASEVHQ